jgi:DNA-binding transcriptional MerR regulator
MAAELCVKTHILRYWEEQFPMLRPLKRAGGRRHYRADDVAMLHQIHALLYKEGYTIKGAAKFLSGDSKSAHSGPSIAQTVPQPEIHTSLQADSKLDLMALRAVRDRLSAALAAA